MGYFTRWARFAKSAEAVPANTADGEYERINRLQQHIVDFKTDRSLAGSDTMGVTSALPFGSEYPRTIMYAELPFFDELNGMQGTPDPLAVSSEEYSAARDRLFEKITPDVFRIDGNTVFTQYQLNTRHVRDIAHNPLNMLRGKPVQVVQYGASKYVLDGHHRIGAQLLLGRIELPARILRLKTEIQ